MIRPNRLVLAAGAFCASSLYASVSITSFTPSVSSPQPLGTQITWTAKATDSNTGTLTFQYSISYGNSTNFAVVRAFYPGALSNGTWTGPAYVFQEILGEGTYHIRVIAKDFKSGEISAPTTVAFALNPVSTGGSFVVTPTANPLVALASAPSCPAGSGFRLTIRKIGGSIHYTNLQACRPPLTSNMFAASMLPSTAYTINYEVVTGTTVTPGPHPIVFTTGALPSLISSITSTVITPFGSQDDQEDHTVLHAFLTFNGVFLPIATDVNGNVLWYYEAPSAASNSLLTRPLPGGNMLTLQDGNSWNPNTTSGGQFLREIDLSGNTIRETNIGVLQQELAPHFPGAKDFGPCGAVPLPAAPGAACLGSMHHDAIRLPNGDTIVNVNIEKIFPPGTQGDTSGLNVDITGDGFIVLDKNFHAIRYFETFQHASGAPQLDINRAAVLGETCQVTPPTGGCEHLFLAGTSGVTTYANDWLHQNSVYYDPVDGDIILSSRHQDWLYKVDYHNGTGTGNILWRMGLDGDFMFNNTNNDPYPWFSHQHDAGYDKTSTGLLTVFDDGNTRVAPPPVGLGSGNSRGQALTVDETSKIVTPRLSQDLGVYSFALGSAHALGNGNYFFQPGIAAPSQTSNAIQIFPTSGTVNGTIVYNLQSPGSYRAWMMPSVYFPPPF